MAHKTGQGSCKNGRDSNPKYHGPKKGDGQFVRAGMILIRQCGTHYRPGEGVGLGRDYTIYAKTAGIVRFGTRRTVNVVPQPQAS